jgi:hypothetical protein
VIERQGEEIGRLTALGADVEFLKARLQESEADRAARLSVIERQGKEVDRLTALAADLDVLRTRLKQSLADVERLTAEHSQVSSKASAAEARVRVLEKEVRRRSGWRRFWPWT